MTINTVNETERMVVTRVFDAPRELVWKAWTDPKYVMQWWGPKGFTAPVCQMDFRVGGKFLCCMKAPDGQESCNTCTGPQESPVTFCQVRALNRARLEIVPAVASSG